MSTSVASKAQRVALLGFGEFERSALLSYLRLSSSRDPAYREASSLASADYVIADADHAGTVDAVLLADRVADTVFIGSLAPDGALAWMMRPIDPLQVFREIGATVALRRPHDAPGQAARAPAPAPAAAPTVRVAAPAAPVAPAAPTSPTAPHPTVASAARAAPAADVPRAAARAPNDRGKPRRAGDIVEPVSALVVDHSDLALHALERQLNDLGLRTETAASSQRALELLARQHFDIVFLDVDLGQQSSLDGLALCQRIKHHHRRPGSRDCPAVVMVSARAAPTDRVRGSFAGCDAYLGKPLEDESLRRSLRKLGMRVPEPPESGFGSSRSGALSGWPPHDHSE